MYTLDEDKKLVKDQVSFHKFQQKKIKNPAKKEKQAYLAERFESLLSRLEYDQPDDASDADPLPLSKCPTVLPSDINGLPEEVLESLNLSVSDRIEYKIHDLIDRLGGAANVDKIVIALYHDTGEIHERKQIASKVYRMAQKGLLFSSATGKGIYTIHDEGVTDDDTSVDDLFDDPPPTALDNVLATRVKRLNGVS